jgi:nitrate/TMAO reductase-like tetraheme cytochrome c subunit
MSVSPLALVAIGSAAAASVLMLWFLVRRPPLTRGTKIVLLFGVGVLPLTTAGSGNVAGYEAMKTRRFCGSCHVMTPYALDSANPTSEGLAARHARNDAFGDENCYTCHADYGMFGTVTTKLGGLRHVYEYTFHFHQLSLEEALPRIHIRQPFPNSTCIHCHSTRNPLWLKVGDHASTLDEVRANRTSCASVGCHGAAHPFSRAIHHPEERAP